MENETIIRLSETNYQVLKVTYGYDDEYDFFVSAEIRLPEDVAPEDGILTAAFRIEFVLESAEKHNPATVSYTHLDVYKRQRNKGRATARRRAATRRRRHRGRKQCAGSAKVCESVRRAVVRWMAPVIAPARLVGCKTG